MVISPPTNHMFNFQLVTVLQITAKRMDQELLLPVCNGLRVVIASYLSHSVETLRPHTIIVAQLVLYYYN